LIISFIGGLPPYFIETLKLVGVAAPSGFFYYLSSLHKIPSFFIF